MKRWIKFENNWATGISKKAHKSQQEEAVNNIYAVEVATEEVDENIVEVNILRYQLYNGKPKLYAQSTRDTYDLEQASIKLEADAIALNLCSKLELFRAMSDLNMDELFKQFETLPEWSMTNDFLFNDPVIAQLLPTLPDGVETEIRTKLIENRG